MQVLEVMRRLNSEGEVRFLLSAYTETLRQHDRGRGLPSGVTALPVADVEDVRGRFETLLDIELNGAAAQTGVGTQAAVREAAEVFGVALARLQTLRAGMLPVSRPSSTLEF